MVNCWSLILVTAVADCGGAQRHLVEAAVSDDGYEALAPLSHEKNANANKVTMKDPIAVAKAEVQAAFK